ncbi:hypothetical protein KL867_17810 [Ruegeria litorea]|uniref:Uncharacterized protein n=1 Tax=Falsiruegeria litorea TaxID=1280831 RepID=A0ABS5WUV5_9RHOB|nr:hypothetical protein [Falsiruegeria litorea]MBT3142929.1 hypothetical protein [Falsiruegeria litorea]
MDPTEVSPIKIEMPPIGYLASDGDLFEDANDLLRKMHDELVRYQRAMLLYKSTFLDFSFTPGPKDDLTPEEEKKMANSIQFTWLQIAAKDIIDSIWNFWWCLDKAVELTDRIESEDLRAAFSNLHGFKDQFHRKLGKVTVARHALAHRAEIQFNFKKNSHKGKLSWRGVVGKEKGGTLHISDSLISAECIYVCTRKGELIEFKFSPDVLHWMTDQYLKLATKKIPSPIGE